MLWPCSIVRGLTLSQLKHTTTSLLNSDTSLPAMPDHDPEAVATRLYLPPCLPPSLLSSYPPSGIGRKWLEERSNTLPPSLPPPSLPPSLFPPSHPPHVPPTWPTVIPRDVTPNHFAYSEKPKLAVTVSSVGAESTTGYLGGISCLCFFSVLDGEENEGEKRERSRNWFRG